jgi:hypothetical protein
MRLEGSTQTRFMVGVLTGLNKSPIGCHTFLLSPFFSRIFCSDILRIGKIIAEPLLPSALGQFRIEESPEFVWSNSSSDKLSHSIY